MFGGLVCVLSIGKLATGQANYYLRQVERRIDRVTSVASGVEDYYLSEGEAAGEWIGTGPLALGLDGKVDGEVLHRVLAGEGPAGGDPLRSTRGTRVPGFDLTFSAPKSVSVLFGICADDVRQHIQRGHDRAVADALGYLERVAASARRGHAGSESVAGEGFVAAAFRHRTSRAGDPQVHTHVLVANLVRCRDGRWSAVDARRIYAHAKTAGYLYEASLRRELTARLGFEWTDVHNGIADVAGVPIAVRSAFSRRRAEIEAELERRGNWSAAAAQSAALETRRSKDRLIDPRRLTDEWRARAEVNGLTAEVVERLFSRQTVREIDTDTVHRVMDELASSHGLTRAWSSFSRRDTIRALCERLPAASDVSSEAIERLADMFLASDRAIPLLGPSRPLDDPLRRGDGRVAPLLREELRYSTPELLAIEQRIVDVAVGSARRPVCLAGAEWVEAAVERRPFLSAEQVRMVRRLTRGSGQIIAVIGKAGTGKTTALSAAHEAWAASGLKVVGVAVARRAARELQDSAGIPSTSVAALLLELRRGGRFALEPATVVVLDEASMVSSRDLGELVDHVVNARGKLVLCGDHRQLPSIRAGGAFRAIVARTDAIELTHNRRQQEQWEREALDTLREGVASDAIRVYEAHDRLVVGRDRNALMERLVSDWWAAGRGDRTAMIALRRADVRRLNGQARALMRNAGMLGPDVPFRCGTFADGDRVVVRRNDRRVGVANGETGLVEAVDERAGMSVRVGERRVRLPPWYLDASPTRPTVQHAYAITGHIAQGMTVERAFVLGSPEMYREWGYTAMSRGRCENRLYVVAPDDLERQDFAPADRRLPSARDSVERGLSTSRAHTIALDTGLRQDVRAASTPVLSRRLDALRLPVQDATLKAALKAHADAFHELERLTQELRAAIRHRSQLERSSPSILRPAKWFRHRDELAANAVECRVLTDVVTRQEEVVRGRISRIEACEADQAHRQVPTRVEQQVIEEELRRRASIERHVSTELRGDSGRETNRSPATRRSASAGGFLR